MLSDVLRRRVSVRFVLALSLLVPLGGCVSMGPKETAGSVIGAGAGAIACGVATGGDRTAMALCAAGGAAIGNRIGAHLDEQDQKRLRALQEKALAWKGAKRTCEKAQKTPGESWCVERTAETEREWAAYSLPGHLTEYKLLHEGEVSLNAWVDTPLYASTDTRQPPVMVVRKGAPLYVPARVSGKSGWSVVVKKSLLGGGEILGYVENRQLAQKTARAWVDPSASSAKSAELKVPKQQPLPKQPKEEKVAQSSGKASSKTSAKASSKAPASCSGGCEGGIVSANTQQAKPTTVAATKTISVNQRCFERKTTLGQNTSMNETVLFCRDGDGVRPA
ncbi:MAG: hypothetical protein LBC37_02805 [Zoogloeaceae bacterium]|jgi:hypothetical protein|nr:hypothetical protein [Zoogloeaceae bacterium]